MTKILCKRKPILKSLRQRSMSKLCFEVLPVGDRLRIFQKELKQFAGFRLIPINVPLNLPAIIFKRAESGIEIT